MGSPALRVPRSTNDSSPVGDPNAKPGLRLRDEKGRAIASRRKRVSRKGYSVLSGVSEPEVFGRPSRVASRVQDSLDVDGEGKAAAHHPDLDTFQGQEGAERERVQVWMRTRRS